MHARIDHCLAQELAGAEAREEGSAAAAAAGEAGAPPPAPEPADPGQPAAKRRRVVARALGARPMDPMPIAPGGIGGDKAGVGGDALPSHSRGPRQQQASGAWVTAAAGPTKQQQQQQQQCPHPSYWAGMCVCCGAIKPEEGEEEGLGGVVAGGKSGIGGWAGHREGGARLAQAAAPAAPRAASVGAAGAGHAAQTPGARRAPPEQGAIGPAAKGEGRAPQQAQVPLTRIRHLHERGHLEVRVLAACRREGTCALTQVVVAWKTHRCADACLRMWACIAHGHAHAQTSSVWDSWAAS